jgi:hypothetical protein
MIVNETKPVVMKVFSLRSRWRLTLSFIWFFFYTVFGYIAEIYPIDSINTVPYRHTYSKRRCPLSDKQMSNVLFSYFVIYTVFFPTTRLLVFLIILVSLSGEVHPNPEPLSTRSSSTSSISSTDTMDLSMYLSFMHYNVQSIKNKLDDIFAEFKDFDSFVFWNLAERFNWFLNSLA